MRAGRLRHTLTIEQPSDAQGSGGDITTTWSTYASVRGELNAVRGGEEFRGHQVHAEADSRLEIRYLAGVTPKMRVTFGSRVFDVLWAGDVEGRGRRLHLDLRERALG